MRPLFLNLFLKIYILCKFLRISNSTKFYLIFKDLFQKPKSLKAIYDNMQNTFWFSYSKPCLLRKEVIHPHVLVGIPCYDLTPITSPTLGASPLAVRITTSSITSSHGVTGSVYKTRERIHRSNADLRLLAIPAS